MSYVVYTYQIPVTISAKTGENKKTDFYADYLNGCGVTLEIVDYSGTPSSIKRGQQLLAEALERVIEEDYTPYSGD